MLHWQSSSLRPVIQGSTLLRMINILIEACSLSRMTLVASLEVTLSERSRHLGGHARADHWLPRIGHCGTRLSPFQKRQRSAKSAHTTLIISKNRKEREPTTVHQPHDLFQLSTNTMTQKQQSISIRRNSIEHSKRERAWSTTKPLC